MFELIESVSSESASGFVIDCWVSEICVKSDSEFSSAVRSITFDTVVFVFLVGNSSFTKITSSFNDAMMMLFGPDADRKLNFPPKVQQ